MNPNEERRDLEAPAPMSGFHKLGAWVAAHPWQIIAVWVVAIGLGAWGSHKLPEVVVGGAGGIQGSPSDKAEQVLRTEFANPFIDPMYVAVSAPHLEVDKEPYMGWVAKVAATVGKLPEVRRAASFPDAHDARLRSVDGHVTMLIIGLATTDIVAQQRAVVVVRDAIAPLRTELVGLDPSAQVAVTGGAAADFDVNAWSATGGDHAEKRALPLTLAILLVAFGTLIAAGLPFVMGLATTTVALGGAYILAQLIPVSNLLGNVVTMIGLAVGIDYSLLMVTHYREHRPGETVAGTVAGTVALAGRTIAWSGLTVMIGFLGLLFSPILETRCAGIGGALVVCISVLAALTLLPAALVVLGPNIDRWSVIPRRFRKTTSTRMWHRLGEWIIRHPVVTLIVTAPCVFALSLPLFQATSGATNERWFLPRATESRTGAEILTALRHDNDSKPIYALVRATDGSPVLAAAHLEPLVRYATRLQDDKRISTVASPVTLRKGLGVGEYTALYQDMDQALRAYPSIGELYLSRDRRLALFEITPANALSAKDIGQLTRDLALVAPAGPFEVAIGGTPAERNDFTRYMFKSFPKIFGFVVGATLILLFVAFRSYLLPLKAVVMNLLAVGAGIGSVVAVFQLGWLNGLVGLERPFTSIPLEVPMMVFCLSFGLSMDYELFLLFRIQREYAVDADNNRATVDGLAAVAPVITGAGLIMAVVFGAFVGAELPVLKMMGVGLCVSVLVDATVIRAFLVPAVMALAGRWNWYPGRSQARPRAIAKA